jgi:FlaA1/EpsC-like NDP-sugar epimerase
LAHDVSRLVMISTDKAIRPVSVMGATKRVAEMLVLDAARQHNLAFCVVRFGNVLGSRGSVVPYFKRQIASGGPVTVTHPEMKRYFMTIPEAVHLVLQASTLSKGGENYILDMGEPVRILDLAEDLIRLSGLEPGKDIEIVFTGIRPGEKLSEDLWDQGFAYLSTSHPDIHRVDSEEILSSQDLEILVNQLISLAQAGKPEAIISLLSETIPGAAITMHEPALDMVE